MKRGAGHLRSQVGKLLSEAGGSLEWLEFRDGRGQAVGDPGRVSQLRGGPVKGGQRSEEQTGRRLAAFGWGGEAHCPMCTILHGHTPLFTPEQPEPHTLGPCKPRAELLSSTTCGNGSHGMCRGDGAWGPGSPGGWHVLMCAGVFV